MSRITGCGNSDGEFIDIEPVEYVRDQCQYQLVKRIAELEARVKAVKACPQYHRMGSALIKAGANGEVYFITDVLKALK